MASILKLTAVLPASDLGRARSFYKEKFGFEPDETDEGGVIYSVSGGWLMIYETSFAGTAENTALTLETDNLDEKMTELRSKGVVFADYDLPGLKTENGVAELGPERGAWFRDSEGNIVAIVQRH